MSKKKYSVLLMYPELNDQGEPETYYGWTEADSPDEAVENVRREAWAAAGNPRLDAWGATDGSIPPEDFHLLAVFKGHLELEERNPSQP